jgi:hypothetical protein
LDSVIFSLFLLWEGSYENRFLIEDTRAIFLWAFNQFSLSDLRINIKPSALITKKMHTFSKGMGLAFIKIDLADGADVMMDSIIGRNINMSDNCLGVV